MILILASSRTAQARERDQRCSCCNSTGDSAVRQHDLGAASSRRKSLLCSAARPCGRRIHPYAGGIMAVKKSAKKSAKKSSAKKSTKKAAKKSAKKGGAKKAAKKA